MGGEEKEVGVRGGVRGRGVICTTSSTCLSEKAHISGQDNTSVRIYGWLIYMDGGPGGSVTCSASPGMCGYSTRARARASVRGVIHGLSSQAGGSVTCSASPGMCGILPWLTVSKSGAPK